MRLLIFAKVNHNESASFPAFRKIGPFAFKNNLLLLFFHDYNHHLRLIWGFSNDVSLFLFFEFLKMLNKNMKFLAIYLHFIFFTWWVREHQLKHMFRTIKSEHLISLILYYKQRLETMWVYIIPFVFLIKSSIAESIIGAQNFNWKKNLPVDSLAQRWQEIHIMSQIPIQQ